MKKFRRRRYLINKSFQPRNMAMAAILIFLVSILTGWVVYSSILNTLIEKITSEPELDIMLLEVNKILLARISSVIFAGMCVSAILAMFNSHRTAGPVFRIRKTLVDMAGGVLPDKIKLREKDEFKELAETVNLLIQQAGDFTRGNRETLEKIEALLKDSPPDKAKALKLEAEKMDFFCKNRKS